MVADQTAFWRVKTLAEMTKPEWESLCDGCAKCCLQKLQDDDTEEVYYTDVVCRYLTDQCRCSCYEQRQQKVPECVWLTPEDVDQFHWLPGTCAYRLIAEGKDLPEWHPLVSGDANTVKLAGHAVVCHPLVKDNEIAEDDWQDRLIEWVER